MVFNQVMPATHTSTKKEATMAALHTVTVTPAAPVGPFDSDSHTLACTCGERVTYAGFYFTRVEADRHAAWHAKVGR